MIYKSDNFTEQYTTVRTEQIHFEFINFASHELFYNVILEHPKISWKVHELVYVHVHYM